jgi:hypothetical protein
VRLSIVDDGRGFDPETDRPESGRGLRSISARVERIGGRFDLSTAPGQGTTVRIDAQVVITEATVRSHVSSIFGKPHLINRVQATLCALQEDIISLGEVRGNG